MIKKIIIVIYVYLHWVTCANFFKTKVFQESCPRHTKGGGFLVSSSCYNNLAKVGWLKQKFIFHSSGCCQVQGINFLAKLVFGEDLLSSF